jgi:hypothetical protein
MPDANRYAISGIPFDGFLIRSKNLAKAASRNFQRHQFG